MKPESPKSKSTIDKSKETTPTPLSESEKQEKLALIKEFEIRIKLVEDCKTKLREAITKAEETKDWSYVRTRRELLEDTLKRAKSIQRKLEGKSTDSAISTTYTYKNEKGEEITENIEINIDEKLEKALSFYKSHKMEVPFDFSDQILSIWEENKDEMQEQIEKFGFDEIIIIPADITLNDVFDEEMTKGYLKDDGTPGEPTFWEREKGEITNNERHSENRIIFVHKNNAKEFYDTENALPILKETLGKKIGSFKPEEGMSVIEYFIYQRMYFEETVEHLDENGWTVLPDSEFGSDVVDAAWDPANGHLRVCVRGSGHSYRSIGCRPSRCFLKKR